MKDRQTFWVNVELMDGLRDYAKKEGRTIQYCHMEAIREYLERHGAKPARRKRVIRTDERSSAAQRG